MPLKRLAAKSFLQSIYHSLVEVPGKVIVHVRTPTRLDQPRICLTQCTPQHTFKSKGPSGVETVHEAIYTTEVVTDEDGSFKIKRAEEFADSKVHVESRQAPAAAKANA